MKCYVHPDVDATGFCSNCARAICSSCSMEVGGKLVCRPCADKLAGQGAASQAPLNRKDPALALILSLLGGLVTAGLIIGVGQFYNGQIKKAIILSLSSIVVAACVLIAYVIAGIATAGIGFCCGLPILLVPLLIWLYALYDAYMTADEINKGVPVKDWLD